MWADSRDDLWGAFDTAKSSQLCSQHFQYWIKVSGTKKIRQGAGSRQCNSEQCDCEASVIMQSGHLNGLWKRLDVPWSGHFEALSRYESLRITRSAK